MDRWDILIVAGAGYVAVMTLVRLMVARRNQLVDQVRQQIEQQRAQQIAQQQPPANSSDANKNDAGRGAA